jgi:type I restriction enzyme S subunit
MPDSLVGDIPDSWEIMSLGFVCERGGGDVQTGPFGSQLHASDYVPVGVPSVMPQNIGDNVIHELGIARITPHDANRLSRYLLREGDIVYSRRGDVERRALVRAENDGWLCGTGCLRVRLGSGADPRFISYYLGHPAVRAWIVRHAIGATMPNLNTKILSVLPVVLPHRCEQHAIGMLLGALDDKITVNGRISAKALELARCLYGKFVHAGEESVIGDVSDVFDGPHATPTKTSDGPWFLSISSLNDGVLDLDQSAHLSEERFVDWTRRVTPRAGDVLFSYETRLGSAALMPEGLRACLGRRMALLRPRDGTIGGATLLHAYLADEFQDTVARRAIHGATVDRIPLTELPNWPITLPAHERRDSAERVLSTLHRRIEASQRESEVLAELRDTLLPKLMSGELRIRDAERQVEEVT